MVTVKHLCSLKGWNLISRISCSSENFFHGDLLCWELAWQWIKDNFLLVEAIDEGGHLVFCMPQNWFKWVVLKNLAKGKHGNKTSRTTVWYHTFVTQSLLLLEWNPFIDSKHSSTKLFCFITKYINNNNLLYLFGTKFSLYNWHGMVILWIK